VSGGSSRRAYIDWARGLAVIVMIEAHTIDAWTRLADRKTRAFADLTILGGFAAPMFLWLAGLGVVFAASRTAERTGSRAAAVDAVVRRGLEIFILAFLFRLQAFIVSPGSHPITIFRVDVLNVMGPSVVLAGLAWAISTRTTWRTAIFSAIALAIAMSTPIVRTWRFVDQWPIWLQWQVRPSGEFTTFTFFPWAGFVFAGAAVGALLGTARTETADRRLRFALAVVGAALVAIGFATAARPTIYTVPASFWTSSPTWFAIRAGIMMAVLAALSIIPVIQGDTYAERSRIVRVMTSWQAPLATMGRASLFVYWIHVELVYGYASWMWRHRLPVWFSAIAWLAFTALMYSAVLARDRLLARRSSSVLGSATLSRA